MHFNLIWIIFPFKLSDQICSFQLQYVPADLSDLKSYWYANYINYKVFLVFATNSDFLIPNLRNLFWRPELFQTMNSLRSNNISLKYQMFTPLDYINIGIEFLAKALLRKGWI